MAKLPLHGEQSRRRRGAGRGTAGHRSRVPEVTFCAPRLARRHPGTQAGAMQSNWHERVDGLLSPLSLAAYAVWVAVWVAGGGVMAGYPVVAWTLRSALVLFLLLFVFEHLVSERLGMRGFLAICAAMAALALWATAMTPHGLAIILLVLLAAVLGSRLAWRDLLLALGLVNLALAAVVWINWEIRPQQFLVIVCAYVSFQDRKSTRLNSSH